jgi:hypothetical protein
MVCKKLLTMAIKTNMYELLDDDDPKNKPKTIV